MIAFEDALKIVLNSAVCTTEIEEVEMLNAIERVLAEDIISDINMPPFDKSAVDGFACRSTDFNKKIELEIIETIPAGKCPEKEISEGKCSKIMTGAMLPTGADCVVMIEDIEVNGNKIKFTKDNTAKNICYLSEDIHINDLVLSKGCFIKPQHIAVLASVGAWRPKVYNKPKLASFYWRRVGRTQCETSNVSNQEFKRMAVNVTSSKIRSICSLRRYCG